MLRREKMGRKVVLMLVTIAFVTFLVFDYGLCAGKEVIELTYANFFPPTHIQAKLGESWIKEIEKRTAGKVKITYFPGGALLKGNQIYDGVIKGVADIGMSCFAYTRGRFPAIKAIDPPMG